MPVCAPVSIDADVCNFDNDTQPNNPPPPQASGLDDYPRSAVPSDDERHVDLAAWVIKGNSVMSKFATAAGVVADAAGFSAQEAKLLATLDKLYWNEKTNTYCDAGKHSNRGTFKDHIVFQCQDPSTGQTAQFDTPEDKPQYSCTPVQFSSSLLFFFPSFFFFFSKSLFFCILNLWLVENTDG